ncbi:MAG: PilZ domain-containing protein [Caulobacteraceae bacterium]
MSSANHEGARAQARRRVLLSGALVHTPDQLTVHCTIQDISGSGARVRLSSLDPLGEPIYLVDFTHAAGFRATIAWRQADMIGLRLSETYDLRQYAKGPPPILRRLWLEQIR